MRCVRFHHAARACIASVAALWAVSVAPAHASLAAPPSKVNPPPAPLATGSPAHDTTRPTLIEADPDLLRRATEECRGRTRLLVVFVYDPHDERSAQVLSKAWTDPTLGAWLAWHAEVYKLNAAAYPILAKTLLGDSPIPTTITFRDGKEIGRVPPLSQTNPMRRFEMCAALALGPMGLKHPIWAPGLLFQLDLVLEKTKATRPEWYERHERTNPMPMAPAVGEGFSGRTDEFADAVHDFGPNETPDPLARLEAARRAARDGDVRAAAGLLTWEWENAVRIEPAWRGVRLSLLSDEIETLARRHPGLKSRFVTIRDDLTARLPWASYNEILEWMTLNQIVGDGAQSTLFLDQEINAVGVMPTRADVLGYEMILRRDRWHDRRAAEVEGASWIRRQGELLREPAPSGMSLRQWESITALRRVLVLAAASRMYALLLERNMDAPAATVVSALETALGSKAGGEARLTLLSAALVAGHPRPDIHLGWIDERTPAWIRDRLKP
ncbi:MAG: hypothetical protein JNM07_07890 [Phycisphaerae bacterium]|nr:hypothetical protein [Phycisphaerae bacterium]